MDPWALVSGLTGIPINMFYNGEGNGLLQSPTKAWDNFKNGATNDINAQIADQNLQFQKDTQEYNRALQERLFEREDTAYQRTAMDMSKAGLNPLTMQGTDGAGTALPETAMHNDYQHTDIGTLQALTPLMSLFQGASDMLTGNIQRDSLRAEIDHQRLINQSQAIENAFQEEQLKAQLENTKANTRNTSANAKTTEDVHDSRVLNEKASAERNQRENEFQNNYGVTDNTSSTARLVTDVANLTNQAKNPLLNDFDNSPVGKASSSVANTLTNTYNIVAGALSNTIGKGAKKLWKKITTPSKNKEKLHQAGW